MLGLTPALSTTVNPGGYADMPLAAFVAGAAAAFLNRESIAAAWVLLGFTTIKNEGIVLLVVAAIVMVLFWFFERRPLRKFADHRAALVVVLAAVALRLLYLRWANVPDMEFGIALQRAAGRAAILPGAALPYVIRTADWGLLWPAFAVAAGVVLYAGSRNERVVAGACTCGLAAYTLIFLFTNWDMPAHIDNAYTRLLEHLAPAAVLTILFGFNRLWNGRPQPTP
jgi:hypothetical protein